MAINPQAFYAKSRRVQDQFKCSRSTADKLVAARYLRGEIDGDMQPVKDGKPLIAEPIRTNDEILKDDYMECPVCHDANKHGDYCGPSCERCGGEGKIKC